MKLVFMGTPEFSLACLEKLIEAGHDVCAVFTQPDKPKNRGKKIQMTPVKECALAHDIPVYQPNSLRHGEESEQMLALLKNLSPDCIIVVAYGQILPKSVLEIPKYGCINVHASLLPRYRGAAPIQRCIQYGEKKTGVTTMYMAEGLDTGDMILTAETEITPDMNGARLHDILAAQGAELIVETLKQVEAGTAPRIPQPECEDEYAKYARMISKEELLIDFTMPAEQLRAFIMAMSDSPCAYTLFGGKRLKVFAAEIGAKTTAEAGTVTDPDIFAVACGDGNEIRLLEIQPEGGKRMSTADFLRGRKPDKGMKLGE